MSLKKELEAAVNGKKTLILVGSGVSAWTTGNAPCATWNGLLDHGINYCQSHGLASEKRATLWRQLLMSDDIDDYLHLGNTITKTLGGTEGGDFFSWLQECIGSLSVEDDRVLSALGKLNCILATTNYDHLIEDVTGLPVVRWDEYRKVERILRGDETGVLHLHGSWKEPSSVILGTRSYFSIQEDEHAQNIQKTLRTCHSWVYVGFGAGLNDPNFGPLTEWSRRVFSGSSYRHFRLAREDEIPEELDSDAQAARIFPVSYGADYADLAPFLESLTPTSEPIVVDSTVRSEELADGNTFETGVAPAINIDQWVNERWDALQGFPTWQEFVDNVVYVPDELSHSLDTKLRKKRVAVIAGRGASGKSVTGVAYVAGRISLYTNGVWFLDLREYDDLGSEAAIRMSKSLGRVGEPAILIIDNAHLNNKFVESMLDRRSEHAVSILFLTRPTPLNKVGKISGVSRLGEEASVELVVDWLSLKEVAKRLMHPHQPPWTSADYGIWVDHFGGDLIAFGSAVLKNPTGQNLTRQDAVHHVRHRYLDQAKASLGGLDLFLRCSALFSLDIATPDFIFDIEGAAGLPSLYPKFFEDSLFIPIIKGPFRHWEFYHAGISDLILEAAAIDRGITLAELRSTLLNEIGLASLPILENVARRMQLSSYIDSAELASWNALLNSVDWNGFKAPESIRRARMILPGHLQRVLSWLSSNTSTEFVKCYFEIIVEDDKYLDRMRSSEPDAFRHFLNWVKTNFDQAKAKSLCEGVLANDKYLDRMRSSPPEKLTHLLNWVKTNFDQAKAMSLCEGVLADSQYLLSVQINQMPSLIDFIGENFNVEYADGQLSSLFKILDITDPIALDILVLFLPYIEKPAKRIEFWLSANREESVEQYQPFSVEHLLHWGGIVDATLAERIYHWVNS